MAIISEAGPRSGLEFETARQRPRQLLQLVVLALGNALLTFVLCAIVPATPEIAVHFSSHKQAALMAQVLLVSPAVLQIFAAPIIGQAIGRLGRRWPFLISLAVYGVCGTAGFFVSDFATLLVLRLICGFASSGLTTIGTTLAGDYFTGRLRDRAVSWLGIMPSAGGIVSLLLGGYLAKYGGWNYPYLIFLSAFPVLGLAYFVIDEPAALTRADQDGPVMKVGLPAGMGLLIFYMFMGGIAFFVGSVQLPFLLQSMNVNDPAVPSRILASSAIVATLGAALYPWLKRLVGTGFCMVVLFVLTGVGYAGVGNTGTVPLIWASTLITGIAVGLVIPLFTGMTMDKAAPESRPRALGLIMGAMFAGEFLTPFLTEPVRRILGSRSVFTLWGLLFIGLGGCIFLFQIKSAIAKNIPNHRDRPESG